MQISAQHLAEIVDAARKMEQSGGGKDKRRYVRHAVVTRVEVLRLSNGTTYAALTRDLSEEGLGLLQSFTMERGEQFSVFLPRIKGGPLLAQSTVLHAREVSEGIWGIGAAFGSVTAVDASAQAAIKSKLEARRIAAKILD